MTLVRQPLLSPIRFHDPSLEFNNNTNFQNPDNRVSHGYDWEGVKGVQYALPIPKQWPDGQPGIDFMLNTAGAAPSETFYAQLWDAEDQLYKDLYVDEWFTIDSGRQYHCWLDGLSGSGIADGYYTIKIFATDDDALLLESEALLIGDWFTDTIPFEFWNFENDFGIVWAEMRKRYTTRIMVPVRMYDPNPQFEKEQYKNDAGILTTLRTSPQRVFSFDSLPMPGHLTELMQFGFGCSDIYLDRIKINSEEIPEAELHKGTNLKRLSGEANFVDFNSDYVHELVSVIKTDQGIDWSSADYDIFTITGDSIEVNDPSVTHLRSAVESGAITCSDGDLLLFKITLTDDAGDSDLPHYAFSHEVIQFKEWGVHWIFFRMNTSIYSPNRFEIAHFENQKAVFTAKIELLKITRP